MRSLRPMRMLTKAIERKLAMTPIGSTDGMGKDARIIVKFFYPYGVGTWLVTEGEKIDNDWRLYGAAELGMGFEWGYVMLSELEAIGGNTWKLVEREMYSPPKTVGEEWKDA